MNKNKLVNLAVPLLMVLLGSAQSVFAADSVDYSKAENWLCLPGQSDACSVDLTATVIAEDGTTSVEPFKPAAEPEFDCFYVYPTVSRDQGLNSDLIANEEELKVIESQFARFASVCSTYAPMYRQITLRAVQARVYTKSEAGDTQLAYQDVEAAFDYYLEHFNNGRPFVLVGHSQGSRMLAMLLKNRFDNKPILDQLVSALLIGAPLQVEVGSTIGGSFKNIPMCDNQNQVGCVVSYVSFRDSVPPPANSLFGKPLADNLQAACVNPALPGSGGLVSLDAYLGTYGAGNASKPPQPWISDKKSIATPFVKVPGLLSAQCVSDSNGHYLAVRVNSDDKGPRVDDIVGDVFIGENRRDEWGLHLVDVSIAQGSLINLVKTQADAWQTKTVSMH